MIPDGVVTWAEIDLDAIAHNVREIKAFVGPQTEIIASVKANAYGHGLLPVARTALKAGATRLAVHRIQVAVALREGGITAPILLLGHVPPSGVDLVLRNRITPTLVDWDTARLLSAHATGPTPVHVKIDTGMSRYGLEPEKALDFVRYVSALPHLVVEGIFSHFATADEADLSHARRQLRRFREILEDLEEAEGALRLLLGKYFPHLRYGEDYEGISPYDLKRTAVFRLEVEAWSGKEKKAPDEHPGAFRFGEQV